MWKILKGLALVCIALIVAFAMSWVVSMPSKAERGVWQHEADGSLLALNPVTATLYHETSIGCIQTGLFPAHMSLVKAMEGAWVEADGDTLELHIDGGVAPAKFNRIDALPDACNAEPDTSAAATFDAMWTIMDEHYAFFGVHGVDWQDRRKFAPKEDEDLTPEELLDRMKSAVQGLDDGHLQILAGDLGFHSPSEDKGWATEYDFTRDAMNQAARDAADVELTAIKDTGLEYGLRDDGIGYVLITRMSTDPGFGQLGTDVARKGFEEVALALKPAKAIIVDVRYNPGGDDGTGFAYASHFMDSPVFALSKRTRKGDGWTEVIEAHIDPAAPELRLLQPTIVLISQKTGSAAEIFTMTMREIPTVTVMGENTGGGLSDILGTTLPNGWQFGLSNQEYKTPDGSMFEGVGVPPDLSIETDATALKDGKDTVLATAIEQAHAMGQ